MSTPQKPIVRKRQKQRRTKQLMAWFAKRDLLASAAASETPIPASASASAPSTAQAL